MKNYLVGGEYKMNKSTNVYAAYSKDKDIRIQSSSGAMFSIIAEKILSLNGVIYGVALSNNCRIAEFIRVTNIKYLSKLRGSKYLQAKVGNTYKQVKKDLELGLQVLFTGTGCQVNGLKLFLGKDYKNLICIDIICHGVPSPLLWKKYIDYIENKNGCKLSNINFRCKDKGWKNYGMKETYENDNSILISKDENPYMQMFLNDYCLRPSCYECAAKAIKKSDITLADFWGIESIYPKLNDGNGVSLVLIRSQKGQNIFDSIKNNIEYESVSYEDGIKGNPSEYKSVHRPKQRNTFFLDMNSMSFSKLKKKYTSPIKIIFKKFIKGIIYK